MATSKFAYQVTRCLLLLALVVGGACIPVAHPWVSLWVDNQRDEPVRIAYAFVTEEESVLEQYRVEPRSIVLVFQITRIHPERSITVLTDDCVELLHFSPPASGDQLIGVTMADTVNVTYGEPMPLDIPLGQPVPTGPPEWVCPPRPR